MDDVTNQDNEQEFYIGKNVLYVKSEEHIELGIIVGFNSVGEPFVLYNTGDTAACTPKRLLKQIHNDYAFIIERVNCRDEGLKVQEKRKQAKSRSLYRGKSEEKFINDQRLKVKEQ